MERAIAIFVGLLFLSVVFALIAIGMTYRLTPEYQRRRRVRWLLSWFFKGFFIPAAIWAIINLGVSWDLQPFTPRIQAAQQAGDPWFHIFLRVTGRGWFVVSSCWAA